MVPCLNSHNVYYGTMTTEKEEEEGEEKKFGDKIKIFIYFLRNILDKKNIFYGVV